MFKKMSFQKSNNTSQSELPIAESTHIEDSTPSKNSKLTWSNKFGLRNNTISPVVHSTTKRNAMNTSNISKLDPTVYLDTQSNGFASRVNKYYEASEVKSRPISNQSYRRPGDFPIVNLEKSELNLNQRKENIPKISKLNIAPPINLVSHASARSAIFRTGKNYGETIGPIGKDNNNTNDSNNTPSSNKPTEPLPSNAAHDEPIVPNENDYDAASARSSLDALKEISRKRIRCEELDGEHDKRKKPENSGFDCADGTPFGVAVKRTRDRISPTNSSPAPEAQKKRYRNNDILSSLSSSAQINTTKRVLNYDLAPAKRHESEKQADKAPVNDIIPVSARPSIHDGLSRIGASNSDLPHHKPAQFPKIVSKSMSDSAVGAEQQTTPQKQASKIPKLTLFNKDYGNSVPRESKVDAEQEQEAEEDENSISFVKPKSSTSTHFSLSKKKDSSKTKLAMMLSFLRGDESKDELDSVPAPNIIVNSEKKEEDKDAKSANLSTSTVVTFSTATTTSVLNSSTVPSSIVSTNPLESSVKITETSKENSKNETAAKPSITFSPMPAAKPVTSPTETNNEQAKSEPSVTTSSPSVLSPIKTTVSSSTTETSPRLGGFAFSATQTSQSSPNGIGTNLVSKSETTQSSCNLNTSSAATISFGSSKPLVSSTLDKPTFNFGSTKTDEQPKNDITPTKSNSVNAGNLNTTFDLGSSIPKPATLESNKISFILPTTHSTASTAQSAPVTSAPAGFSFGSPAPTNANTSSNTLPTNTGPSLFAFGSNKPSAQTASPFDSVKSPSTSLPSYESATNTNNSSKPQFGNSPLTFGNNNQVATTTTTASSSVFGSNSTQSIPAFGGNVVTTTSSAFGFGNNSATSTNSGGNLFQFGNNAKPTVTTQSNTFGMASNLGTTSASTTNPFGTTGSSVAASPLSKTGFAFGNKTESPLNNSKITTTTATSSIFGSPAVPTTAPPPFGSTNANSSFGSGFSSTFGQPNKTIPSFGTNATSTVTTTASSNMFGLSSPPAFASSNNIFGSANSVQASTAFGSTNTAPNTPAFGSVNNTQNTPAFGFSNPSTTQANQNAFAFGQTQSLAQQSAVVVTTASIFGSGQTNTNTNSFVFGQSNTVQASSPASGGIFGSKPAENNSQTAPPAFGNSTGSSVFNFSAPKPNIFGTSNAPVENKPAPFSFNAPSNSNATGVSGFGSASSSFGSLTSNNANQAFAFGAQANQEAPKPFNFNSGPTSAPPSQGTSAPFSFNAPNANAFQFNAGPQQPATPNIFSIGPGTPTTTKTGRPMRTATRRIK